MTIRTFDEADNLTSGDLLYRYQDTTIFPAYIAQPELSRPGLTSVTIDAEEISVVAVAVITGTAFQVFWKDSRTSIACVPQQGVLVRSETVARRLFPALFEYTFKGK